jgi:Uncharacterized conserved protein
MNVETLNKYYENGLLYKQTHPTLPLTIWNYSEKVQYEGLWDEVTVQCRGLITENNTGKVLVRPFAKFFNYEEVVDKNVIPLKGDYVYVQEKMDGSLGILFYYEGEWIMATRGSFTSEQAIRGMEILKKGILSLIELGYRSTHIWLKSSTLIIVSLWITERRNNLLSAVLNEGFTGWKPTDETELHWTMACSIFAANGIKKI